MKKYLILAAAVTLAYLIIPAGVCFAGDGSPGETAEAKDSAVSAAETVAVFMPDTGKAEEMDMREYVISALAAEMPAAYEEQALRAQACACVTLTRYLKEKNAGKKTPDGADITADPATNQGYMTVEEMKSRWGSDFKKYYEKLCAAVDEVLSFSVTYEGRPALTAFHAISPGVTETAQNVWDKNIPYLVSVDSAGDTQSPGYLSSEELTKDEIIKKLSLGELEEDAVPTAEESYTRAGTLRSIKIYGKTFTGEELRSLLALRSAAITISEKDGVFTFEVRGYGHGVGMSQYGANCLAKEGKIWREILAHYYPGTEIQVLSLKF